MENLNSILIPNDEKLREIYSKRIASSEDENDAFLFCNLADVVAKYQRWTLNLPRVRPFYAVKCNPDTVLLKLLAALGCGFDCASKAELAKVLGLGVSPDQIIFANPCKPSSHIKFASVNHVNRMTFDNEPELRKIKAIHPEAQLILRIRCGDSKSVYQLGKKFGCDPQKAPRLLQVAKELSLNVVGLSFHVGSGCLDASAYGKAIETVHAVFQQGANFGFDFTILDIGGGFPGSENTETKFEDIGAVIHQALDEFFPVESNVQIIAEPGRYIVASAFTLAVSVIAKTEVPETENGVRFMYYLNDGVYGTFSCVMFDHANPLGTPSLLKNTDDAELHGCTLWGPTCDCVDCVMEHCRLPELDIGDWLFFSNMGAYTTAAASTFNGFPKAKSYYILDEAFWNLLAHQSNSADVCRKATVISSFVLAEMPLQFDADDVADPMSPCSLTVEAGI